RRGDLVMRKDAVAAEQARQRGVEARHPPSRCVHPAALVWRAGDGAEARPQLDDIPTIAAEETQRRRAVAKRARSILEREQSNQRRLASAVRTKNHRVL